MPLFLLVIAVQVMHNIYDKRSLSICASLPSCSPSFVFADTIIARIAPTDVTVFTQGAEVTRKGQITLPSSIHEIVIPDMRPNDGGLQTPEIKFSGATMISQKWQNNNQVPLGEPQTEDYKTAKNELDSAKEAVVVLKGDIATNELVKQAAKAQIEFLNALATSDTLPDGIDTLRDLSRMISQETLAARTTIQQADIQARTLSKNLPDLQKAVARAQRIFDALLPTSKNFAQLTLTVSVYEATTSDLSLIKIPCF